MQVKHGRVLQINFLINEAIHLFFFYGTAGNFLQTAK